MEEKQKTLEQEIADKVIPYVKRKVNKELKDLYKNVVEVTVKKDDVEISQTMVVHEKFKNLLLLINNNIPVMLTGSAGSGKTSTCRKVAEALKLDYYFSNAITQEYRLTGFIDANGKYHETQFYKAFKNGGLFVLDEIDASTPDALIILNTAIANKYFDFPTERVEAHENFRVVACANTYGLGADDVYVGRNQLDGATLDRFAVMEFDYDTTLENSLLKDKEWGEFIQLLRKNIRERKIRHIVSMRASIYGDKLIQCGMPVTEILQEIVFKNLTMEDIKSIGKVAEKNTYAKVYNTILQNGVF